MFSVGRHRAILVVLLALSVAACRKRAFSDDASSLSMSIPAARGPKVLLTKEEKALVYPDVESMERDPFLFLADEQPEEESAFAKPRRHISVAMRPLVIKQLHETVRGIIIGPRNTFFFQGKLYEEGDKIPETDWVVASITPAGINLRSRDGATDRLAFVREADGSSFTFKKGH